MLEPFRFCTCAYQLQSSYEYSESTSVRQHKLNYNLFEVEILTDCSEVA